MVFDLEIFLNIEAMISLFVKRPINFFLIGASVLPPKSHHKFVIKNLPTLIFMLFFFCIVVPSQEDYKAKRLEILPMH